MIKTTKIYILIIFLILFLLLICFFIVKNKSDVLKLYGNIENRTVNVGFRIDGRVKKMFKKEGDSVKKGEILAVLDSVKYQALYDKAIADADTARAEKDNAVSLYNRHLSLCKDGTTSPQECDRIDSSKDEAISRLESAIQQTILAKDNLNNTVIYAPTNGIILTRTAEEGAIIDSSSIIYSIVISEPAWVRAYVSEEDMKKVKYHMAATVETDLIDPQTSKKRTYSGYVGFISPSSEFIPKTLKDNEFRTDLFYRIRVYIEETDEYLKHGMPVTVKIDLKDEKNKSLDKRIIINNSSDISNDEKAIIGY